MGEHAQIDDGRVTVTVVRTGGFAGLRREWRVEPPADEAAQWIALIEECPWDAPRTPDASADRYIWRVHACAHDHEYRRDVTDAELSGAWRALVDAVRAATLRRS